MTQEDKNILLKDICARLPYGVIIKSISGDDRGKVIDISYPQGAVAYNGVNGCKYSEEFKPYLRPMSSMTEEEYKEYDRLIRMSVTVAIPPGASIMKPEYIVDLEDDGDGLNHLYDWLNAHHFDYRGMIEKGLALEAPADMYKTE